MTTGAREPTALAAVVLTLVALVLPGQAWAQETISAQARSVAAATEPQVSGAQPGSRLVVEPIHSGPVVAPDFKVTEVDGETSTVLGGYAGWLHDESLLLGAGGYWLLGPSDDVEMFYGGFVLGWSVPVGGAVRFGARGLIGGGWAELNESFEFGVPDLPDRPGRPVPVGGPMVIVRTVRFGEEFFVFEPQVDVSVRLAPWLRMIGGVGYRVVAADNDFDDRLRGITGSLAIQFGGGS